MEDLKKIKQDGYYISTPEFALMLNISTEALRSRRRRGELRGQYKFDGKKYWWQGRVEHRRSQFIAIFNHNESNLDSN